MSEPESTEAKLITPQSSGAAVPKLTKPIMPVPNLPKTTPATPQNTFDYKKLINSFGKTYDGYMYMYRLMNGAGQTTTDNVYGSTLNIPLTPGNDSTINLQAGSTNAYNIATKTLTYNPDLTHDASVIAYMEFLPAGGKNENCGKQLSLETGIETLF